MRALLRLAAVLFVALAALASPLANIGRGTAIVFSPDLSLENNCAFYERLGFVCYASPSWEEVVEDIRRRNASASPDEAISVVILEAHGTQGNGLRLQTSSAQKARRSYAAVGALRERLGAAGVRYCVIAACNSRRLLRPAIHDRLDRERLFLPATLGIMNAAGRDTIDNSPRFLTRADSYIEGVSVARTDELSPTTRRALGLADEKPMTFVVSDMLAQLVTGDPALDLREAAPIDRLQRIRPQDAQADALFTRFVEHLDRIATSGEMDVPLVAALAQR